MLIKPVVETYGRALYTPNNKINTLIFQNNNQNYGIRSEYRFFVR